MSVRAQANGRAARPARRRPAARRNPDADSGRIKWDRLGRIAFVALVFILVFSYFNPLYNLVRTYRQAGATKAELHRVQAENTQLERRVNHVRSESVLRREARRQGLIVPGEQGYVVNGIKR